VVKTAQVLLEMSRLVTVTVRARTSQLLTSPVDAEPATTHVFFHDRRNYNIRELGYV
jgi:hypothetical protein